MSPQLCPTCGALTVLRGRTDEGNPLHSCEKCGTLITVWSGGQGTAAPWSYPAVMTPALVVACREFERLGLGLLGPVALGEWNAHGIAEAIHKPEDRTT